MIHNLIYKIIIKKPRKLTKREIQALEYQADQYFQMAMYFNRLALEKLENLYHAENNAIFNKGEI